MRFIDVWDFETDENQGGFQRSQNGDFQTKMGEIFLNGDGFTITSDWVNVNQSSSDAILDWFSDKSQEVLGNKVGSAASSELGSEF